MINTITTILIAVLVFGFLIFVHELGHFLAAKWAGVKVNEFSLGMGPAIYKKEKGETTYSLRAFPIGGYISMEGEDDESGDERAFCNKPPMKRFVVLAAGAAMNLLVGFIIMIILVSMGNGIGTSVIGGFAENAKSSQWLMKDDKIVSINGAKIRTPNDITYEFVREKDGFVDMEVLRDGQRVALPGVEFEMQEVAEGVNVIKIDFMVMGAKKTIVNVPLYAIDWSISIMKQIWGSFMDLITGNFALNQLSGPVGVATAIGEASSMGIQSMLMMIAFITINLGIFNLLPLPALDGGRLFFLLIEAIRGKPIKPEYEGYVHTGGLFLLLGLMFVVTFNDIMKLFT